MRIEYDNQVDALYIELRDVPPHHNVDINDAQGISVDVDDEGMIVGIEVLGASRLMGSSLSTLTVENLMRSSAPA